MPGFYGVYLKRRCSRKTKNSKKTFESMTDILQHRRDFLKSKTSAGNLLLGKISLPQERGLVAPLWNEDLSCIALLDGMIFSYRSDGMIYEIYDSEDERRLLISMMDCLKQGGNPFISFQLNGEYNLIFYDVEQDEIILGNDRWGFRELYYYNDNDFFVFAPEVKAILCHSKIQSELEELSVIDFLNCGYVLNNRTLIKNIFLLPPHCRMHVRQDAFQITSEPIFFKPDKTLLHTQECLERIFNSLSKAVERRLRRHNKVTAWLSGGLDSRLICAFANNSKVQIQALTLGDKECNEFKIATQVSKELGLLQHYLAKPRPEHFNYTLMNVLTWLGDGMVSMGFFSTSFKAPLPYALKSELLIGGFGGDHTIGGSRITKRLLQEEVEYSYLKELILRRTRATGDIRPYVQNLFDESFAKKFNFYSEVSVEKEMKKAQLYSDDPAYQQDFFLFNTRYRRLLNQARGLVGHIAAEEYYPFFDNDFFDILYSIPAMVRYDSNLLKALYTIYFPKLSGIKWLKTGRPVHCKPSKIIGIRKSIHNFLSWYIKRLTCGKINLRDRSNYAEHDIWYRKNQPLRNLIESVLLDRKTLDRGLLRKSGIHQVLERERKGYNLFGIVDRMIILEVFCRQFVDSSPMISMDNEQVINMLETKQ